MLFAPYPIRPPAFPKSQVPTEAIRCLAARAASLRTKNKLRRLCRIQVSGFDVELERKIKRGLWSNQSELRQPTHRRDDDACHGDGEGDEGIRGRQDARPGAAGGDGQLQRATRESGRDAGRPWG